MPTTQSKVIIKKDEERELIRRYQQEGCEVSLERLVMVHNPYVQHLAGRAYKQFNKVVEFEDLVQQARIGLIRAAQQFDLNKVVDKPESPLFGQSLRFLTFAHHKIIAHMQEAWHHAHVVHIPAHVLRAIHFKKIAAEMQPKAQENAKIATLALKPESYDLMVEDFRKRENRSNSFEIQFNENGVRISDPTYEDSMKNIFSPQVQAAIKRLNETEWKIFQMKAGLDGNRYRVPEIAKQLNLSIEEVDRLFKRARRILNKHIDLAKSA